MTARAFRLEQKYRTGLWRHAATYTTLEKAVAAIEAFNPDWAKGCEWRVVDRRYNATVWPTNNTKEADR